MVNSVHEEETLSSSQEGDEEDNLTRRNESNPGSDSVPELMGKGDHKNDIFHKFQAEMMRRMERMQCQINHIQNKVQNNDEMQHLIQVTNGIKIEQGFPDVRSYCDRAHFTKSLSSITRSKLKIDSDREQHLSLPLDTFSLMMVSKPCSGPWCIGFLFFAVQLILLILWCIKLFTKKECFLTQFAVPRPMVSFAQFSVLLAIFLAE